MSGADLHQILIPYLYAGGAMALIVLIAALLLQRDGAGRKANPEAQGDRGGRKSDSLPRPPRRP